MSCPSSNRWTGFEAQRAIATLHSFRFFGLVFIVPGVVGPHLPAGFATFAAYGDFATGLLAMLALLSVRIRPLFWLFVVAFNLVGAVDIIVDYYHGNQVGLPALAGELGAIYCDPDHLRASADDHSRRRILFVDASSAHSASNRYGRLDRRRAAAPIRNPPPRLAWAGGRPAPCRCFRRRRRTDRRHRTRAPTTPAPAGISSLSSTSPVRGSMRRNSLSSPSQVPCQSSPSTQVTPVTKRLDSMVRRIAPVSRIDLMDLAVAILPHPERAFGPGEPRVAAAAGRRDRGEHPAGLRIDLLDAILGDLKQVLRRRRPFRHVAATSIERTDLSARRIEGVQPVAGGEPDMLAVEGDPVHVVDARKGSIFAEDFGC